MTIQKLTAIPLAALALAVTLTGCAGSSNTAQTAPVSATPAATAVATSAGPTAAATTPAAPKSGDLLPTNADRDAAEAAGLSTISSQDGSVYAYTKGSPLPANVVKAVVAPVANAKNEGGNQTDVDGRTITAATLAASTLSQATGHNVAVLISAPAAAGMTYVAVPTREFTKVGIVEASRALSHDVALSRAEAWVNAHPGWEVVDAA